MRLPWQVRAVFRPIDPHAPIDLQVQIEGWRRALLWGLVLLLAALAAVLFARPSIRAVRQWHARRLAAEAQVLITERSWNAAGERIRDAFAFSPSEPTVLLAAARLTTETGGVNQAYELWTRVCALPEVRPEHRLELALATIRAGRPTTEAVAQLEKAGAAGATSRGRVAAAAIAFRQGEPRRALGYLREAVRLEPANAVLKLQLASGLMTSPAREKDGAAEAALLLYEVQEDPREGLNARRLLRQLRLQAGDLRRAREEALEVVASEGSAVEDRLELANILRRLGDRATLEGVLSPLLTESMRNRPVAAALVNWMFDQAQGSDAARVLERVPADWRRVPPLSLSYARLLDDTRRIADLREHLRVADWTECEPEREAWNARLAQLQNSDRLRSETWAAIEKRAGSDREILTRLLAVSRSWRWPAERSRLLQQMANLPPVERSVLEDWRQSALAAGLTDDACNASWQLLAQGVTDPELKNDAARTALLLGRKLEEARQLAADLYAEMPGQPDFAATHIAALRRSGQLAEAQRILKPWEDLTTRGGSVPNRIAFERAAVLAAAGQAAAARIAASLVASENLLPEEGALLRKLQEGP